MKILAISLNVHFITIFYIMEMEKTEFTLSGNRTKTVFIKSGNRIKKNLKWKIRDPKSRDLYKLMGLY